MATYYGGKNHLFRRIINLIPQHDRFVELFGGSAAVSRNLARRNAEAIIFELDVAQARILRKELPGHRVYCDDAIAWLRHADLGRETVLFADPPYPIEDRRDQSHGYNHELTNEQHEELAALLRKTTARVLVCGHPWGLYPRLYADWKRHEFRVILRSGLPGVECVWTNFADPYPLHDYRWWGDNKRVRQDLRRLVTRNVERFERMERHQRMAVIRELVDRFAELRQAEAPPEASAAPEGGFADEDLEGGVAAVGRRRRRKAAEPSGPTADRPADDRQAAESPPLQGPGSSEGDPAAATRCDLEGEAGRPTAAADGDSACGLLEGESADPRGRARRPALLH